jgi:hypothetical protein
MRNVTILATGVFLPLFATGQCDLTLNKYHPFGSCAEGQVHVSGGCEPGTMDSLVWSNGQTGYQVSGLAPGTHNLRIYNEGEVIQTLEFEIVQLAWTLTEPLTSIMGGAPAISGWADVQWCNTSAWNHPCCVPVPEQTYVRLVQDGTTEITTEGCMGCESMPCTGSTFMFNNVPAGHSYHIRLYDLACGNVVDYTTTIVVHSADNLELLHEVIGTEPGAMQGEVHLLEAVPDPTEPYPLQAPVIGTAKLYRGLEGWDMAGEEYESVASATWTGLDTGYYRLEFTPDLVSTQVTRTVYVSFPTSIGDGVPAVGPALLVGLTEDPGRITVRVAGGTATHVELLDALGRSLPIRKLADGSYNIGAALPGTYLVRAMVDGSMVSAKFIVP